jgi:hypothetical protein
MTLTSRARSSLRVTNLAGLADDRFGFGAELSSLGLNFAGLVSPGGLGCLITGSGAPVVLAPTLDPINGNTDGTGQPRQDYSSTVGGDANTVTGANLALVTLTVGGTSATILSQGANFVTFVMPAKTANAGYDIVVTNISGSATLAAAIEYLPAFATVISEALPEEGSFGAFVPNPSLQGVTAIVRPASPWVGTHAVQCSSTLTGSDVTGVQLNSAPFSVSGTNGIYTESVYTLGATTLANNPHQIKLHLTRVNNVEPGGTIDGPGTDYPGGGANSLNIMEDFDPLSLLSATGVGFGDGVFVRVLTWYFWDGAAGHMRKWVNGKKITLAAFVGSTALSASSNFSVAMGEDYCKTPTGPIAVILGRAGVWDGCPLQPTPIAPVVPAVKAFSSSATLTVATPSSVTTIAGAVPAGAYMRVGLRIGGGGIVTVTYNNGTTNTVLKPIGTQGIVSPGGNQCYVFAAKNVLGASAGVGTITVTNSDSNTIRGAYLIETGPNAIAPYDTGNVNPTQIGTSNTADCGSFTGSGINQFSGCFVMTDGDPGTITAPAGWTARSVDIRTAWFERIDLTATTVDCQPTFTNSVGWVCVGWCTQ